ncbi:MAG: type II toxin-antitoxin system RelE/ParE family toxin [Acidobacteriota bacterium]|nr:type II toxin-antitoxin system RelE/ParE family toxin [Acidobacteriota bacterium]
MEVREYVDELGRSRYGRWFGDLEISTRARVEIAVTRLGLGNLSNIKSVGEGVTELRMDFGPGFRAYFGRDGDRLILLLGGGTKQGQQNDIKLARAAWRAYKRRKAAGEI